MSLRIIKTLQRQLSLNTLHVINHFAPLGLIRGATDVEEEEDVVAVGRGVGEAEGGKAGC